MRRNYANVVATAALAIAVVALVLAIGADGGGDAPSTPAEQAAIERVPEADRADEAERAQRADTATRAQRAQRARTADRAREAASARRLSGVQGRRLADAARRAGGIRRPKLVGIAVGDSATVFRSGPFRVLIECSDADGGTQIELLAASTHPGSVASIEGAPAATLDEGGRVLLRVAGDKEVWSGGRSFSLTSPRGSVVEGVLAFGINQFDDACAASAAGIA